MKNQPAPEYATYLSPEALVEIRAIEKELKGTVIAFATPSVPAKLKKSQLAKIKKLEKKHCVQLVAYAGH